MGYHSDFARTVLYGEAERKQLRIYEAVVKANQAMIDAIRPGVSCREIYRAGNEVLLQKGVGASIGSFSFGHGVGLNVHELPNINSDNREPLEEGMVLAVEPWVLDRSSDAGLFNKEDVVVVRDERAELLAE